MIHGLVLWGSGVGFAPVVRTVCLPVVRSVAVVGQYVTLTRELLIDNTSILVVSRDSARGEVNFGIGYR